MSLMMMKTNQITPPPELLDQWCMENNWRDIAIQAAQWGADQELEACCELTRDNEGYDAALRLRGTRRPKPPSLKEQALEALEEMNEPLGVATVSRVSIIRRALEALDD
jgi:beta-phosphoglucomutase-like phosphatase (HAD superfamily)